MVTGISPSAPASGQPTLDAGIDLFPQGHILDLPHRLAQERERQQVGGDITRHTARAQVEQPILVDRPRGRAVLSPSSNSAWLI